MIFIAAVAVALSTAAMPGNDGPFTTTQWTSGLYAQQMAGAVNVFPNPASDQINIVFPGLTGEAVVSVLAEDGRLMDQFNVVQTSIQRVIYNTANLNNGIYFVRVQQANGRNEMKRLIIANTAQSTSP